MLANDLNGLLEEPSPEARRLARRAIHRALDLRSQYGVRGPNWLQNVRVSIGLASRGKCCDWARDLLDDLEQVNWRTFELHWAVAYHGLPTEHSSIAVVKRGADIKTGVILDGWRHAGFLYWAPIADDPWPWRLHPADASGQRIACKRSGTDDKTPLPKPTNHTLSER